MLAVLEIALIAKKSISMNRNLIRYTIWQEIDLFILRYHLLLYFYYYYHGHLPVVKYLLQLYKKWNKF